MKFNTVEEALDELRAGKIILVTDDEDRENEGDFICAAEFATTENINFMAMHGKGLICMPMSQEYVKKLRFPQMVQENTDNHETAFTVSIDHVSTTTGISAAERSITVMKCVSDDAKPEDFRRPGHMFPLLAKKNGVLERNGHTEATVDLCRLAGLKECGLCCEIMREDGTMMRTTELMELAKQQVGNVGGYPYWSWYGFNSRVEWCACFVSWCYNQAGKSEPRFAGCEWQGVPWFQSRGQWGARGYENIAPGDAIFFDWDLDGVADHVGLVLGRDGSRVYTVEGNSGDACKIKSYDLNYQCIKGYGLMNW